MGQDTPKKRPRDFNQLAHQVFLESIGETKQHTPTEIERERLLEVAKRASRKPKPKKSPGSTEKIA